MRNIKKKYSNGEVTIVWEPSLCQHSAICFKGLPAVFNPREKPWITPEGSDTSIIVNQINQCPSKALSFYYNTEDQK